MIAKSVLRASSSFRGSGCPRQKDAILGHPGAFVGASAIGQPIWAVQPPLLPSRDAPAASVRRMRRRAPEGRWEPKHLARGRQAGRGGATPGRT